MKDVNRQTDVTLVVSMIALAAFFAVYFLVMDGQVVQGWARLAASIGLVALALGIVGFAIGWQAHRLGGWRQVRAFRRAVRRDGILPEDIDEAGWRRQLELISASMRPSRQRVMWIWFGVTIAVAQTLPDGFRPLLAALVAIVGALVGLAIGQLSLLLIDGQRANIDLLLRALDNRGRARASEEPV